MLRFFRQIRQRLLTGNKFSKYLLYAIGEIFLVVIGILIALQIDNWNDQRQQANSINLQLVNLLSNLKGDRDGLVESKNYHAFRVHASYYLLRQYGISENFHPYAEAGPIPQLSEAGIFGGPIPDTLDQAFVDRAVSWLVRFNPGRANTSAMEEFKSTGLFSKFANQSLKDEIQDYYAQFTWVFPAEDSGDSSPSTLLRNSFVSKGISYLDVASLDNPVEALLSEPTNVALLKIIIDESTFRSNMAALLLDDLDGLIGKLTREIEGYTSE